MLAGGQMRGRDCVCNRDWNNSAAPPGPSGADGVKMAWFDDPVPSGGEWLRLFL